jgi:hypothetical protein
VTSKVLAVATAAAVLLGRGTAAAGERRAKNPAAGLPVEISVKEHGGVARPGMPVTGGVPLPRGAVQDAAELVLVDAAGGAVPCQADTVTRWPDGSVKWVELNFQADLAPGEEARLSLGRGRPPAPEQAVRVTQGPEAVTVDTGAISFTIPTKKGAIIGEVTAGGKQVLLGRGLSLVGAPRFARGEKSENWGGGSVAPAIKRGDIQPGRNCGTETWTITPVAEDAFKLAGTKTGDDGTCRVSDCLTRWGENPKSWRSRSGKIVISSGWWTGAKFPVGKGAQKRFETDGSPAGTDFSTLFGNVEEVLVERSGPMMARVYLAATCSAEDGRVFLDVSQSRGKYRDPSGDFFKVRVRMHAYAGKPFIYMVVSLTHEGPMDDSPDAYFGSATLKLRPTGKLDTAEAEGVSGSTAGGGFALFQHLGAGRPNYSVKMSRKKPEPHYRVLVDGREKKKGDRASGSVVAGGAAGKMGFGVRRFHEYAPTAIAVKPDAVSVGLLPDDPEGGVHVLDQGRQRSHEVLLDFSGEAAAHLAAFQAPRLLAVARPSWYADLEVFGMIAEEATDPAGYPEEVGKALRRFEQLQKCVVDGEFAENKRGTVFDAMHPGWIDHGDLPWTCDWSNLHYDWTLSMMLHFLRTGKREFFEAADAMAWHRMDIAQNHCMQCGQITPQRMWSRGLTYYEKDDHRRDGQGPKATHTWNRGLGYYALLTGNETARRTALLCGHGLEQFYDRYGPSTLAEGTWAGNWKGKGPVYATGRQEQRLEGWSIENFLGCYEITGDEKWLKYAINVFKATLLDYNRQKTFTGKGIQGNPTLMFAYCLSPSCRLHHYSRDPEVLAGIRYLIDEGVVAPYGNLKGGEAAGDGKERVTSFSIKGGKLSVIHNVMWANPIAYVHMQTGEKKYLELARKVFRNGAYYYTYGPTKSTAAVDPGGAEGLSPAAYHDGMYAGSVTKAHGWIGRYGQIYLYMEKHLAGGGKFPAEAGH